MPTLRRLATGLTALLALAAALAGVPWLLLRIGGRPSFTGWDRVLDTILIQDTTGRLLVTVLIGAAWLAWAGLVLCVLLELVARTRSGNVPRVRFLAPQQHLARVLIGAVLAMAAAPALHTATGAPTAVAAAVTLTAPAPGPHAVASANQATPPTTPDTATPGASAPVGITITVRPGDNLWDLAETHLGDGRAWKTIADANYTRTQPGGAHLGPDHTIRPGWTLLIPGAQASPDGPRTVTVQRGDTLSRLAQRHLGDAGDWPQLQRPDHPGAHPDRLLPGERVLLPTTVPGSADQAPAPAPPPAAPTPTPAPSPAAGATPTPGPAAPAPAAPSPAVSAPGPGQTSPPIPTEVTADGVDQPATRTVGGVGLLLASGLVATLALHRRRQHARRRSGQRIAMPAPATATTESQLREVHERDAAADLTTALQLLAAAAPTPPVLRFAHLTPDRVEVILDEPAQLPGPWSAADTRTCWSIARDQLPPPAPDSTHPYPALVSLGDTDSHCHLLIDLETAGSLAFRGKHAFEALTALATELAMTEAAAGVNISLVGFGAELAQVLGPEVQHLPTLEPLLDHLDQRAAALEQALLEATTTLLQARVHTAVDDTAPHVVFISQPQPAQLTARLQALTDQIPRLGIASVALTTEPGQGRYQLLLDGPEAILQPVGIRVTPQLLGGVEYAHVLDLLATTRRPAHAGPDWGQGIDTLTPVTVEPQGPATDRHLGTVDLAPAHTERNTDEDPEGTVEPAVGRPAGNATGTLPSATADPPDTAEASPTPPPPTDQDLVPPLASDPDNHAEQPSPLDAVASLLGGRATRIDVPLTTAAAAAELQPSRQPDPTGDEQAPDSSGPVQQMPHHPPRINVLGPLQVLHTQGPEPASEKVTGDTTVRTSSHTRMAMITLAYLALKPGRATSAEQLAEQLSFSRRIQPRTISQRLSRTRTWLGYAPDGQPYLLLKAKTAAYALHPEVTTDWHHLLALIGPDITTTPLENLTAALELVRDRPFIDVPDRDIPWAEELRTEMTQTIADLAHVTAIRAMAERNYALARAAIAKGRRIDDVSQDLWADVIELELLTGHTTKAQDLADDLAGWANEADLDLNDHAQRAVTNARVRARSA